MSGILTKIQNHRTAAIILTVLIFGGGYYYYKYINVAPVATRYVLAKAEKGMLIVSVSGTGQVSATSQVDIKPKVSGDIVFVNVKNGDEVKAGTLLFQLDDKDAAKSVRDAETNLESAKLSLEKLKQPADTLSVLQSENSLIQAQETKQNSQEDLQKSYDDGFNTVSNAFLDLPSMVTGLNDLIFGNTFAPNRQNINYYSDSIKMYDPIKAARYTDDALNSYQTARTMYDKNFNDYKLASRFSDRTVIESLISETYDTTKNIAEAVKNMNNLIQLYQSILTDQGVDVSPFSNTQLTTLNGYTGKTNTHLSSLLNIKTTIQSDKDAIVSADRLIEEKTQSLAKLKAGADPLDIQSQQLSIKQRENALLDAKSNLVNYYVRAPFDGVITKITNKKGDSLSSGAVVATLLTKQKIATITLNEVDVVKAKSGQKATLTFDAIEGLSITGEVVELDSIGTVAQGVVTYGVKIVFDTQDERVKSGMSVSVAIITEARQNVLLVPNSAVKQQGGASYVEIAPSTPLGASEGGNVVSLAGSSSSGVILTSAPCNQTVEAGLSNDTMTEIIFGLNEGDNVVTRTITAATSATPATQSSGLRIPGLTGGGGR